MVWSSSTNRKNISVIVSVCMVVQMLLQSLLPFSAASAAESTATTVTADKITFKLPKSSVNVKAIIKGGTAPVALTDPDGDGTYSGAASGLTPGSTLEYKFAVNDVDMVGYKEGTVTKDFLTATVTEGGISILTFAPKFYVQGSYGAWALNEMKLNTAGTVYEYTSTALVNGLYEYQFVAEQAGPPKLNVYMKDPQNALVNGSNSAIWVGTPIVADTFAEQANAKNSWVLAGDFQRKSGNFKDWDPTNPDTKMTHLVGGYYVYSRVFAPGTYTFKFTKNGKWDDAVGTATGDIKFTLTTTQKVNFYLKETDSKPVIRTSLAGVAGVPQYVPVLPANKWPRLVGDFQSAAFPGEVNNDAASAKQYFVDYNFDNSVYKIQRDMPVGKWAARAAFGSDLTEFYGANGLSSTALSLNVLDPTSVVFTLDYSTASTKKLTHDYKPADTLFDGKITTARIEFDSRSTMYKQPFGAIPAGSQSLTLRIAADKDDVQMAKVEFSDGEKAYSYDMKKIAIVPDASPAPGTSGARDLFEVVIPKEKLNKIAVWSYKFVLVDGSAKVEYGDDALRGGTGQTADEGALPYELTVYNPTYKTPDWMKGAIVYQIFPDRFFDGSKENNRAKVADGSRGERTGDAFSPKITKTPLQYFDGGVPNDPVPQDVWGKWSDVPENPNRITAENKPYFPDAKSDKVWGNEFYGGDIQGISQKLDYLKSLGVTVIYLNPVAWAASNHKYDATDYGHLDPMFGAPVYNVPGDPKSGLNYAKTREQSDKVFSDFAKTARSKGIRLIVDGVFNHVGDDSIYFDRYEKYPEIGAYEYWARVWQRVEEGKTQASAEQEVRNWYTAKLNPTTGLNYVFPQDFKFTTMFTVQKEKTKWGYHKFDAWWGFDSLPAMDALEKDPASAIEIEGKHEYNNDAFRELIVGETLTGKTAEAQTALMKSTVSQRWNWMGSRGWRLDVAPEVSDATWVKFRQTVKSTAGLKDANGEIIDEPLLLAEEWGNASKYLLGDTFDSVMNYRFRRALQGFLMEDTFTGNQLNAELESIREDYPAEAWNVMLNLVGSHDVPRHITKLDNPKFEDETVKVAPAATERALKLQALTAIFQMGYPGSPMIYYGDEVGLEGTRDPDSRRTFPWGERVIESTNGTYSATPRYQEVFNTFKAATNVRTKFDLFQNGEIKLAYADANVLAYARKDARAGGKAGLVAINKSAAAKTVTVDVSGFIPDGVVLRDQLFGAASAAVVNGKVSLNIPAYGGFMMVSEQALPTVAAVGSLALTTENNQVKVTWNGVSGADKYNVWRSLLPGGTLTKLATVTTGTNNTFSYTDTGLTYGVKYYYTITALSGASESAPAPFSSITPAYVIDSLSIGDVPAVTVGIGNAANEVQVTIEVSGLNGANYTGKAFPNVLPMMAFFPMKDTYTPAQLEEIRKIASETKLRYRKDAVPAKEGNVAKVYAATVEPYQAGTFHLFAKAQLGEQLKTSAEKPLSVTASADVTAPTVPSAWLKDFIVESNKARVSWLPVTDADVAAIEVWRRKTGGNGETAEAFAQRIAVLDAKAVEYTDYVVSNDVAYEYQIAAVDASYNRALSAVKMVTPKLIMVEVTIRTSIPNYTPETDDIYIAGTVNNWAANGWKLSIPNGKSGRDVLEYTFKMMAGKQIQYKFTRGSWDTEAFTSQRRVPNDMIDPGNWFYSDMDTNMKLKVENQGNGKMLVNDYIIGYKDMPMIISQPRKYFGGNNDLVELNTTDKTITLQAKVPYGVNFTINGKPLEPGQMNEFGEVKVDALPLTGPTSIFDLKIEPTEATKKMPWFLDAGRASQATKKVTLTVTNPNFPAFSGPVMVAATGTDAAKMSWVKPSSSVPITGYTVYLNDTLITTLPGSATSYEMKGLRAGVENNYRLQAQNEQGYATMIGTLFTIPVKQTGTTGNNGINPTATPYVPVVVNPVPTRSPVTIVTGPIAEPDLPIIISPVAIDETIDRNNGRSYSIEIDNKELLDAFEEQLSRREQRVVVTLEGEDALIQQNANLRVSASVLRDVAAQYKRPFLSLETDAMSFDIPIRSLDLYARAESIGADVNDVDVIISLQRASETVIRQIKAKVAGQSGTLLSVPVDFRVSLSWNGRTFAIDQLGDDLVARTVKINKAVKSNKVSGLTLDARTGDLLFAPSVFIPEGTRTAVTMMHPVNGLYFLAQLNKSFDDLYNHFARTDVTYMANKMLASELFTGQFRPNQAISREQFAVMLVRSLGLPAITSSDKFLDLSPNDKYAGYCYAADAYGLMSGTSAQMFSPDRAITRSEMAIMLSRALTLAGRPNQATLAQNRLTISAYSDRAFIPSYAQSAVAHVSASGVMKGATATQFQPKAKVSRAQATIMLKRMLETIGYLK